MRDEKLLGERETLVIADFRLLIADLMSDLALGLSLLLL
jgi:hypothetical protein